MSRGSRTALDVKREIVRLAATQPDTTASAIIHAMNSVPEFKGRVPETRTVQHIMRGARRVRHAADAWSLASAGLQEVDPGPVLETLAAIHRLTGGRVTFLTLGEAELITRIRRGHQGMGAEAAYVLAQRYLARREAGDQSTLDLDLELALQAFEPDKDVLDVVDVAHVRLEPDR